MSNLPHDPLSAALRPIIDMIADAVAERLGRSRFLTAAQIPDEFGIAPRAIRTAVQKGELRGRRVGHAVVFERTEVERWLASKAPRTRGVRPGAHAANDSPDLTDAVARSLAASGLVKR